MPVMQIHPNAIENYNRKAKQLLESISDCSNFINRDPKWTPKTPSHKLSSDEIQGIKYGGVDYKGEEVSKYFITNDKVLGFKDEGYIFFFNLAHAIQKNKNLINIVSLHCVKEVLFDWVAKTYQNIITQEFISFFFQKCTDRIEKNEIWIPIAMLFIESQLKIGRIKFVPMSGEIIDKWHANALENTKHSDAINKIYKRIKDENTACAASVMEITAERQRAYEIAIKETEFSLRILRIFSPAIILPDLTSYCIILGSRHMGITRMLSIKNDSVVEMNEKMQPSGIPEWELSNDMINTIRSTGLDTLNQVFHNVKKTDFQKTIITSLELYSKSSIARDVAERLIYIFAALEYVFLKNNTESIQQNVSERMAIFGNVLI